MLPTIGPSESPTERSLPTQSTTGGRQSLGIILLRAIYIPSGARLLYRLNENIIAYLLLTAF